MVSLYRGNLHRVPNTPPRRWPMPPPSISLRLFRILIRNRSQALARLFPATATAAAVPELEAAAAAIPEPEASAAPSDHLDPNGPILQPKIEEGLNHEELPSQELTTAVEASSRNAAISSDVKIEVSTDLDIVRNKEDQKQELEMKLQVLNEKKHHLVQMLKQILNAEEEIKRRSIQSSGLRVSVPLPAETACDMGSVTRHAQKISIEANICGDLGGEPTQSTSPSASSLVRSSHGPFQNSTTFQNPRPSMVATVGQLMPMSSVAGAHFDPLTSSPSALSGTRLTGSS